MIPAVAFRHPDDFLAGVLHVVAELAPAVEEGARLLVNHGPGFPCRGIDFDDPDSLMSALCVLEG
jgi:hypothetical protein